MPDFLRSIFSSSKKDTAPLNRYEGFTSSGAVIMRDRRGTLKAEYPLSAKSEAYSDDPLAIFKPTGAKHVSPDKAMANFTGWSYAAVNAIASEVANIQLRLYQIKGKDHEEVDDHPILDLLQGVNETTTGVELKYITFCHLELTGNFFWLLDGVKNENDEPTAIFPLNPGRVRVKVDKSTFPYRISHYEFTIDGKVFTFQPWQILQGKYPDPNDPFMGIGVPQTIPAWIDSDNYAMEYNRKFFINGANIGMYLTTESNVEGQLDRIKQGVNNKYAGTENAHKIPVLPKGVKFEHTGVTHKDMDFGNLQDVTRDRILAAYRVSKTILGTAESDVNRATSETADYVFAKRTIKPKMLLFVSYLNEFLVPRFGDDLYLTFIDPVPEDKQFRTQEMQAAVANMPVMTQNEARKSYLGLGPVEGGDKLMTPAAMQPIGATEQVDGEETNPTLAKTVEGWKTRAMRIRPGGKTATSNAYKLRKTLSESFKKAIDRTPAFQVKSITDLTRDEYMEHWKRFSARSEEAKAELHKVFVTINRNQKEEVIANLADATGVQKAIGELFNLKDWMSITIDLVTPIVRRLARDEASAAFAMIGVPHKDILANESIAAALDQGIAKMARSYNETTLDQLKKVLTEEMNAEGGTTLAKLTDAVDGVYSFADERRAGMIAKTESYRAANWANKTAWQESGVVKTIIWYTAEDDHVCPDCASLDGKEIAIDAKFFDDDYSGGDTPPRHPDCRCYSRPGQIES